MYGIHYYRFVMKFFPSFYETALHAAVENENIDIVKLLMANKSIDPNILNKIQNY